MNRKNECPQKSCKGCRHYTPDFVITDDSGRKCALFYYNAGGMTLEEIGQLFGVSRERIRQIENNAIKKLQHASRTKILSDFVSDKNLSAFLNELEQKRKRKSCQKKKKVEK